MADLIPPGKQRDAILLRRFDHEIARLLEDDFLRPGPGHPAARARRHRRGWSPST